MTAGGPFRLAAGGLVDRDRPLAFAFNGRRYEGLRGDTLASALLANGVHMVARSFRYHRPRGIVSAGLEEPSAFLQIGAGGRLDPNMPATAVELHDGLEARTPNCWPGLGFDLGAVADAAGRLLVAGFYYKTFMAPARFWPLYERLIRRAAGVGRAPAAPDPDRYEERHALADVLVVGAGPSGLMAARAAARLGARVILAEADALPGGGLLSDAGEVEGRPGAEWAAAVAAELGSMPNVRVLTRTVVFGYYDHNFLAAVERSDPSVGAVGGSWRQRLWQIRARQVVLATGAHERPIVFADNDRPGIMLASAAATYVRRYAVRPGRRAVVFTNNDSAYRSAAALEGIEIAAIVDARPAGPAARKAADAGARVVAGHAIVGTFGRRRVRGVEIAPLRDDGTPAKAGRQRIACDLVCLSGGWSPVVHLFSQSGGEVRYDEELAAFLPGRAAQATHVAGALAGRFSLADCLADGAAAGRAAAAAAGYEGAADGAAARRGERREEYSITPLWSVPAVRRGARRFVDFFSDVTAEDVALAAREGYRSVEHLKRYTTAGMGADQGKTANVNALALLAAEIDAPIAEVGTTTFRPPYAPVTFGVLAARRIGAGLEPLRRTPIDSWHEANGAVFENFGLWRRPQYFGTNGASLEEAVVNECRAVREAVGLMDVSTLGKLEIRGPDAARLLNRVYTNRWDTLAVGRCRYGVMLGEDGMVMDDGVTARLGPEHYVMTTTTGGAEGVFAWLEEWLQGEWPELRVFVTPVGGQWATVAVAGPSARALLQRLVPDEDLSAGGFPAMAARETRILGVPARIFGVSFTGERSFEVAVPAGYGRALWEALMTGGEDLGVRPVGIEAMDVLRTEKGHFVVGRDSDGTATPLDLGLERLVDMEKSDFIGRRSLLREEMRRPDRLQLVGLVGEPGDPVPPEGGQILADDGRGHRRPPLPTAGHVTTACMSPTLGRPIALAMLAGGRARLGETVTVWAADRICRARVADPRFYDPEGRRPRE